jgi:hypothetical protein
VWKSLRPQAGSWQVTYLGVVLIHLLLMRCPLLASALATGKPFTATAPAAAALAHPSGSPSSRNSLARLGVPRNQTREMIAALDVSASFSILSRIQ